jgi:hypothetical protein
MVWREQVKYFASKLDVVGYLIIEILFVEGPLCVEIRPLVIQISHPTKELILCDVNISM